MNCYTFPHQSKFYCLYPINPNYIYFSDFDIENNTISCHYLSCIQNSTRNPIHREDGPAIEDITGFKYWYYHGKYIPCKDNEEFLKIISMKAFL